MDSNIFVVEKSINTKSWYRVYSDGWIEQCIFGETTAYGGASTFTFLKPFKNTNYTILATLESLHNISCGAWKNPTKTNVAIWGGWQSGVEIAPCFCYVCGY